MKPHPPKKPKEPPEEFPASWRSGPAIFPILLAIWSVLVTYLYFDRLPIHPDSLLSILDQWTQMRFWHPYLLKGLVGILTASWILWACVQVGQGVLDRLCPGGSLTSLERLVFGGGIGIGVLSNAVLLLGAVRLWYASVFYAGLAGITGLAWFYRKNKPLTASLQQPSAKPGFWNTAWHIALAVAACLWLLGSLSPEVFFDSLHYHLGIPAQYGLEHRLLSVPSLLYANFTMTLQMLYGLGITIGNTLTAKFLHLGMAGLLGLALFGFSRRYLSAETAMLSVILFLGIPMTGITLTTAGIDIGYSALQFLAAFALIRALDETSTPSGNRAWLWIAGGLTGLSASCKYTGFPFVPIAGLLIVWRRWDEHQSGRIILNQLIHFMAAASLFILPQLIKNMVFNHNPVYPFLGTHWGIPRIDVTEWNRFFYDQNPRLLATELRHWDSALRFIFHPWFLTLENKNELGLLGPLCLLALPALFWVRARTPAFQMLRRYAALTWLLWLLTTKVLRYSLPMLALASPLFAETLIMASRSAWIRTLVLGSVLAGTLNNFSMLAKMIHQVGGWQVVGGWVPEAEYLGEMHPTYPPPSYDALAWMNTHLPAQAKVLFMGDCRSYYLERRAVPSSTPGGQAIVKIIRESRDGTEVARRLREEGVTHLFLNFGEAVRTEGYQLFPWDPVSWPVLTDFWNHSVRLLWKKENFTPGQLKSLYVYELLSETDAARPHEIPLNFLGRWAPSVAAQKQLK
ncbi:MAG: glycosyltransferase family 39 protein [Elusimicrobiota bacterium]|jgi:hypothetical protein